ncbi:contact-dependent growth inhibition system immunity protein [Micromonospora sp. CPCC 205546]|uniref:contact-dependent growth inhibition system immunity protein n=1 Tax=Micromonospora sp. CPCC 205546 TaxID=3122397 RepID=UPI002FEFE152
MLGQQIGVPSLLPVAVQVLLRDPLAEGDHHPGDLLLNVLRLPASAWSDFRTERERLASTEVVSVPRACVPRLDAFVSMRPQGTASEDAQLPPAGPARERPGAATTTLTWVGVRERHGQPWASLEP